MSKKKKVQNKAEQILTTKTITNHVLDEKTITEHEEYVKIYTMNLKDILENYQSFGDFIGDILMKDKLSIANDLLKKIESAKNSEEAYQFIKESEKK